MVILQIKFKWIISKTMFIGESYKINQKHVQETFHPKIFIFYFL